MIGILSPFFILVGIDHLQKSPRREDSYHRAMGVMSKGHYVFLCVNLQRPSRSLNTSTLPISVVKVVEEHNLVKYM